jgi:hypothetical protein
MNWLERARREISKSAQRRTANSAERTLTAVMEYPIAPFAKNGRLLSAVTAVPPLSHLLEIEVVRDEFEERAAINSMLKNPVGDSDLY